MSKIPIDRSTVEQVLEACPFCGNEPSFSGDASEWKDESRYVELSLGCCVSMTEQIGWRRARDMTHEAKTAELRSRLQLRWNTRAALAEPQPLYGWVFKRNADGSIGIFAPPPKPGESQRTSDCVGTNQRDLNELLGKLADHMAALAEPFALPCPTPKACKAHCCSGNCMPRSKA